MCPTYFKSRNEIDGDNPLEPLLSSLMLIDSSVTLDPSLRFVQRPDTLG